MIKICCFFYAILNVCVWNKLYIFIVRKYGKSIRNTDKHAGVEKKII